MHASLRRVAVVLSAALLAHACDMGGDEGTGGEQPCVPGVYKCQDGNLMKCTSKGTGWAFYKECEFGCKGGKCTDAPCKPSCSGKECGDNGCGGVCGHCLTFEGAVDDSLCQPSGVCADECELNCLASECGPDGCGGSCGKCWSGDVCVDGQCLPQYVTVMILDAVVGPGKSTGEQWDAGSGTMVPQGVVAELLKVLDIGIPAQIVQFVLSAAVDALAKPDPFGYASLFVSGQYDLEVTLADTGSNIEDTFTPVWPGGGNGWVGVPFHQGVKVKVELYDEDLLNHDAIGTAVLNYDDMLEAWAEGKKHWVNVASQTTNQLLLVGIDVSSE